MNNESSFSLLESVFSGAPFQANLGGATTVYGALFHISYVILTIAIAVSFIYMAYSFVSIAGSWGDEKLFAKARDSLFWSIGSFIISIFAYVIVHALYGVLGG